MASRDRSETFRLRLLEAMKDKDMSKSALARRTNVDRSTIGQLLKGDQPRMPNAQLAADIAAALGVSVDWLLSLSNRPEPLGDILASAMAVSSAERSSANAAIEAWHRDAIGSKVRHVPASMPEMLKTQDLLDWEYAAAPQATVTQISETATGLFEWLRTGQADYEIALPLHEVTSCAAGTGYYNGLPNDVRRNQLNLMADQCDALFPRLRIFLFDARKMYSSPITVFGNALAILYVGKFYLSLRESQRVTAVTEHFDWLVRGCEVDARDVAAYLRAFR
ncbi:MAG: helix-turn-helix domain-containing protein [Pseudomonadota bacterium]